MSTARIINKMFSALVTVMCLITAVSSDSKCDNVKCPPSKHYTEIGCTPVKENSACCPTRFQCPDKPKLELAKCYWNGKAYNLAKELPVNETIAVCLAGCVCEEGYFGAGMPASFYCAEVECAHFLGSQRNACTRISTLDNCCPKHICGTEEINKLSRVTCTLDGKIYHIGEKMYPDSHDCYACICSTNFNNATIVGNPACKEIDCGITLRNYVDVHSGCIPDYYGAKACCPNAWRCPRTNDVMISSRTRSSLLPDLKQQCKFGKLTLNIGDEIKSEHACTVCKCLVPPMAHCVETPNCKK